ncbi:MAG: polysaccharide deacetylase family protein [Spirulinaceae cyanobacterium RM2_2_10]|nr:polysaccharide deacetylase family protein [Spirulinaceae cyanobacterium SM2_1_0]NJO19615.1 polysaccharide deacetylase family protein [Spirulinaceae cyanobacterium RM2_2_10]
MQLAPLYPWLQPVLSTAFPDCLWSGDRQQRRIALSFDDGPHPEYTPALLNVLARYPVRATFFWLGVCVERYPEVARAVSAAGHALGLHGYDHRSFWHLSEAELLTSLQRTQAAIAQAGIPNAAAIRDVRPPNGLFVPHTLTQLRQAGYRPVMWSVVPEDWLCPGVTVVQQRVLRQVQPGALIVLHDGHCGGADVAATTARLLPALLARGYELVTVATLWGDRRAPMRAGAQKI